MKLLSKTIRSYLVYAAVILLIAVPVFYFTIRRIMAKDVDVRLHAQKAELLVKLGRLPVVTPPELMEDFEPDIRLTLSQDTRQYDTLYTATMPDNRSDMFIPYRVLETNVSIKNIRYKIQLKSSLLSNEALIKSIVLVQFLLMVAMAAGLLLINQVLSKKLWLPFYRTLRKLQGYKIEDGGQLHFDETDIDEFTNLNNTISALTKRNEDVYQSQKEFTENAAHEMQSPLAVFQSKTELLMQTSPLSREQAHLISDLADAGQRMARLNKSLLLLAKIDNDQFPGKEPVDIAAITDKTVKQYHNAIKQKEISLSFLKSRPCIVMANKALIEIMLVNLLSNSIRHNVSGGVLHISVDEEALMIQNTGIPAPLDGNKLFRRFQKQSSDTESSGLGLEIVKKICMLNKFTITYSYENQLHTFIVRV